MKCESVEKFWLYLLFTYWKLCFIVFIGGIILAEEMNDILKMCSDTVDKIIADRSRFFEIFMSHCADNEEMKEKFGSLLLEKSEVYDSKDGLNGLLAEKMQDFLKDFYKEAIIGDGVFFTALEKAPIDVRIDIMDEVSGKCADMAEILKEFSFDFEDIVMLDDRAIQKVLRDTDQQELAKALKGANEETAEKIYRNMSKRAAGMLQEDMEFMGPVRKCDVLEARDKICKLIRRLEDNGDIVISRGGEDELVY